MSVHPGNLAGLPDLHWQPPASIYVYQDGTWGLEPREGCAKFSLRARQKRRTIEVLPVATLRALVDYDPLTGAMAWRVRPDELFPNAFAAKAWNSRFAGKPAFRCDLGRGYLGGEIFSQRYKAHRVVWALHYGEWPDGEIDHIDHDPSNNHIDNLRLVDRSINLRNRPMQSNNTSGLVGIYWTPANSKWFASIGAEGESIYLGLHSCLGKAIQARKAAEAQFGFHPNHGKRR